LEDAACLVFLENYLAEFSKRHSEEKVIEVMRKTWRKMSPKAQEIAMALELEPEVRGLVERAIALRCASGNWSRCFAGAQRLPMYRRHVRLARPFPEKKHGRGASAKKDSQA